MLTCVTPRLLSEAMSIPEYYYHYSELQLAFRERNVHGHCFTFDDRSALGLLIAIRRKAVLTRAVSAPSANTEHTRRDAKVIGA